MRVRILSFHERYVFPICICFFASRRARGFGGAQLLPLNLLDSLTPFDAGPLGPDPGDRAECCTSPKTRTQSGRTRPRPHAPLGGVWALRATSPEKKFGAKCRACGGTALPRVLGPQGGWGGVDWFRVQTLCGCTLGREREKLLFPRAVASRLRIGSGILWFVGYLC